jgi:hypothetical protein
MLQDRAPFTPDALLSFAGKMFQVKAFLVANKLGIFSVIADEPKTPEQIASELHLDARAVKIIARAMAAMGLLNIVKEDAFILTQSARAALDPKIPWRMARQARQCLGCGWRSRRNGSLRTTGAADGALSNIQSRA